MVKAVIIEDMPQALEVLKADLSTYCPDVTIVGHADSVVKGAKCIKELDPDLVFLDVELGDGTGFDLLEILPEDMHFQLIFTTVSDEHAIRAFRFSAIDYLLKPINPEDLKEAVEKAKRLLQFSGTESRGLLLNALKSDQAPRKIALHTAEKINVVPIQDIYYCQSDSNYTIFRVENVGKLMVSRTLKEFDQLLHDQGFLRVHHSYLVNMTQVTAFDKADGGYLTMKDGENIPVAHRRKTQVLRYIERL